MARTLQIGHEAALGLNVGVAYIIAGLGLFAAEITLLSHDDIPPYI